MVTEAPRSSYHPSSQGGPPRPWVEESWSRPGTLAFPRQRSSPAFLDFRKGDFLMGREARRRRRLALDAPYCAGYRNAEQIVQARFGAVLSFTRAVLSDLC